MYYRYAPRMNKGEYFSPMAAVYEVTAITLTTNYFPKEYFVKVFYLNQKIYKLQLSLYQPKSLSLLAF